MTAGDTPRPGRDQRDPGAPTPTPERPLPADLPEWTAVLTLWPAVDEPRYHLAARCFGHATPPGDWPAFVEAATGAGVTVTGTEPGTLTVSPDWSAALHARRHRLGKDDVLRSMLVDAWLAEPADALVPDIARWATALRRWDAVEESWMRLNGHTAGVSPDVLGIYRDLPTAARRERPFLTMVSGAAASVLAVGQKERSALVVQRVLLDSAALHSDWATREDTDAAVAAGSLRMLGERRLPSAVPGRSLEAAWRTKQEVDALIAERSGEGRPPGPRMHAVFRAFSARLAIARADPRAALAEARSASALADWEPMRVVAHGLELLAASVLTETGPHPDKPLLDRIDPELGAGGLRGMGETYEVLADLYGALRALDRGAVERALTLVTPEVAAIGGVWAIRAAGEAFHDALWGDPGAGLSRLADEFSRESVLGREQAEPLGGFLLFRARMLLLSKAGAFAAAGRLPEGQPDAVARVAVARMHLWAGDLGEARRVAVEALRREGEVVPDRSKLALIAAAAAFLAGDQDDELREEAASALRTQLAAVDLLPLASLPRAARDAVLAACAPAVRDEPNVDLLGRLDALNDAGGQGVRTVRLTQRERVLLPMLATDDPVPEIARKLYLSVNTVRKQVVTLREKFDAESRADLVRKATAHGAIPGPEESVPGPDEG